MESISLGANILILVLISIYCVVYGGTIVSMWQRLRDPKKDLTGNEAATLGVGGAGLIYISLVASDILNTI